MGKNFLKKVFPQTLFQKLFIGENIKNFDSVRKKELSYT